MPVSIIFEIKLISFSQTVQYTRGGTMNIRGIRKNTVAMVPGILTLNAGTNLHARKF